MTAQAAIADAKDLFWRTLSNEHIAVRKPGVWRNPLGGPMATPEEVFGWLRSVSGAVRRKDTRASFRLFANGKARALKAADHPTAEDGSVAGYVRRLDATYGEAGFVVNNFQGADPEIWRRAQGVLAGLAEADGVRPGAAIFDLFAGAYRSGFFGVHKDDQDVVTFVLEGRKRFLLWPYEYFATRPEVAAGSELKVVLLKGLDYAAYREDAIVVEGEPGDVFYWPAEWWHVAESDGELCTTFALGLFRDESRFQPVDDDAERLARTTAFGYFVRPDPLPRGTALPEGAVLHAPVPRSVAWNPGDDGVLLLAAGGAIFRFPAARPLVSLLERAASGAPLDVNATVAALGTEEVEPAALRHLIGVLFRHHALVLLAA